MRKRYYRFLVCLSLSFIYFFIFALHVVLQSFYGCTKKLQECLRKRYYSFLLRRDIIGSMFAYLFLLFIYLFFLKITLYLLLFFFFVIRILSLQRSNPDQKVPFRELGSINYPIGLRVIATTDPLRDIACWLM